MTGSTFFPGYLLAVGVLGAPDELSALVPGPERTNCGHTNAALKQNASVAGKESRTDWHPRMPDFLFDQMGNATETTTKPAATKVMILTLRAFHFS